MGCRDQESNFNHFVYNDGGWWCGWGLDLKYTAPTRELIEEYVGETYVDRLEFSFDEQKQAWNAVPKEQS